MTRIISNDGTDRNRKHYVDSCLTVLRASSTGRPVFAHAVRPVVIIQKRGDLRISQQDDIPAASSVTPVRTTEGFELLTVDGNTPVAAVAGVQV
jgi:hypothetical protein